MGGCNLCRGCPLKRLSIVFLLESEAVISVDVAQLSVVFCVSDRLFILELLVCLPLLREVL